MALVLSSSWRSMAVSADGRSEGRSPRGVWERSNYMRLLWGRYLELVWVHGEKKSLPESIGERPNQSNRPGNMHHLPYISMSSIIYWNSNLLPRYNAKPYVAKCISVPQPLLENHFHVWKGNTKVANDCMYVTWKIPKSLNFLEQPWDCNMPTGGM